ncbi:hypothetical protein [Embleya sp. NPDC005575]|uniref:hypothetical protein n=1 Tax=Embleya sp. NPDC005575 TaxID=3156892 RepID=UPI0033AEB237
MERVHWPVVVDRAREIVAEYDAGVTLRQLRYRAISEQLVPNTPSMYRRLSSRLAQARREGRFPDLVDTLREVHVPRPGPTTPSSWTRRPTGSDSTAPAARM